MDLTDRKVISFDDRTNELYIKQLSEVAEKALAGRKLEKSDIIQMTFIMMRTADKFKIPGSSKKELVIKSLKKIVNKDESLSQADKMTLDIIIEDTVGIVIDGKKSYDNMPSSCCIIV
jgi:hypothetical protein